MRVTLPDCQAREDLFGLTAEERRELVRRIAEGGPGAIDEFIKEREKEDGLIARKVAKLREELMRRAEELRRRLAEGFGEREAELEAAYRARLATLQSREEELRGRLERLRVDDASLAQALRANPLFGIALDRNLAARAPWWRRALAWVGRALRFLLFPLLWVLRLLFPQRERGGKTVGLVVPQGIPLDRAGDLYLADATFRAQVRTRLKAAPPGEKVRRLWERMLGREDYESLARKAMEMMLAEEAEKTKAEAGREESRLRETLGELVAQEEEVRAAREADARRLEEERRREEESLAEAIRRGPEDEVKEAIVDELKAAGLLREGEKGLLPTLQFMDHFAALVYHDETRGGRAGQGAVGEYAEGEGHYRRSPLRSSLETSRMDIPASLLRARSRHPKVRHMFDDDVVVYREERTNAQHVVLIVDRSGSMEENGRMDAAKRAALSLHHAAKSRNPRNRVDLLLMDTSVRSTSLREVWEVEPRGFTNTGAALRLARGIARSRKGGNVRVYLVTDGLPEAYTKDGEDVAGHPDKAMEYARRQARLLGREANVAGFVMLLLEPENEMHVRSAETLAKDARGRVVAVDPKELVGTLLRSYEGGAAQVAA